MICPKCGAKIDGRGKFCGKCGASLSFIKTDNKKDSNYIRLFFCLFGVTVLASLLFFAGIYFYKKTFADDMQKSLKIQNNKKPTLSVESVRDNENNTARNDNSNDRRNLFMSYLKNSENCFPDEKLEMLNKAAELYPADPDLKERNVPRFTVHEEISGKYELDIEKIVVDWQENLEWLVSGNHTWTWNEANKWCNNLRSFQGGGWKIPGFPQFENIRMNDGKVPKAITFLNFISYWSVEDSTNLDKAFVAKFRDLGELAYVSNNKEVLYDGICLAYRDLRRDKLPAKFFTIKSDPKLKIGEPLNKGHKATKIELCNLCNHTGNCPICRGSGRVTTKEKKFISDPCPVKIQNTTGSHFGCNYCGGDGRINERYEDVNVYVNCKKCNGTGWCPECNGRGYFPRNSD